MSIRFIPANQITDPLPISIGLSGGSGTGKTYSALRLARGIAEGLTGVKGAPIGFIDTENRRGLHYREAFPEMMHLDFTAVDEAGDEVGFTVDRWLQVVETASAAGLPSIVIDSFSHAWGGVGGVLEAHAKALDRLVMEAEKRAGGRYTVDPEKYNMLAWADVKPPYRRLVDAIIRAKTNFIICTRAKPVMQKGFGPGAKNAFKAKHRREDVPWNPETDADLMFECTAMMILDPAAPGCPVHQIKCADQFKKLFDPNRPMTEATGRAMAEWSRGQGDAHKNKAAMDAARDAARGGSAKMRAWCAANAELWAIAKTITKELQGIASEADQAAVEQDDPFGLPPVDPITDDSPTPEQIAAAEEAARQAAARSWADQQDAA